MTHPLIALQAAETRADQLRHRRQHLPEQAAVDAAAADVARWEQARDQLRRRMAELETSVTAAEADSHAIDSQRSRLSAQLKTVIAPREAEALMHQIAVLDERRSAIDDAELAALEEQSEIDDQLATHEADEPALRAVHDGARNVATAATAAIDDELEELSATLPGLRAEVDSGLLARYDRLRRHQMVAAAALSGARCEGCHLDLSASELDDVRAAAAGGVAECPHCARLLVI